jgi:uncharacterized membrane protein YjgN (DUF898 family)
MPIYLAYFLISVEAEHLQSWASIPLFASFYVFGQFAIYRARRYRLTRTVWRGVRFWMDGSGWAYALRASLWALLAIVTLGIALPWRSAALERYKMEHSWYGDLQGTFVGQGWELFRRVWWIGLLMPGALILFPALPFLYSRYKTEEWRWWISGIRFGGVTLASNLAPNALHGLYWSVIGWYTVMSMAFGMFIGVAASLLTKFSGAPSEQVSVAAAASTSIPLLVVTAIGYLALALALGVVARLYLTRDLWERVLQTTTVTDLAAAANVTAKGDLATAVGEGIADGLDVAGF